MNKIIAGALLAALGAAVSTAAPAEPARVTQSFDTGWRFLKADVPGAEQSDFADGAWRQLDVPHDWSIEGPFAETNRTGGAGGFLPGGVGWYRKYFTLPENFSGRQVFIEFDGVMQNSEVWINGVSLGKRPSGYVSFGHELTPHLNFGAGRTNVLAVRADTSDQPASRWYSGAGIYRHVRLVVTDPVHFGRWGNFVTTTPVATLTMQPGKITPKAMVQVQSTVTNQSEATRDLVVQLTVLDPDGKSVAESQTALQTLAPGQSVVFNPGALVRNPQLWDLDHPKLYRAVCQIRDRKKVLDEQTTSFGIREFHFDADTGFWLNGKNLKIKGVCLHHDGGAFGAAVPLGVWEERLKTLKSLGVNAIRTAHNPPAPEVLDLCDRMGFLVMDELFDCWTVGKHGLDGQRLADYHLYFNDWSKIDTADTVRRDRNHPSVIVYSAGNEIHDTPKAELAKKILAGLVEVFHANDPTRPVSQALFRPNASHDYDDGLADLLDVVGQNYRENEILAAHQQDPARKIIGTENRHDRATWLALRDNAPYAGQFLWTGVDYLGEAKVWPTIGHGSGLLDRTGEVRPLAGERQSWWSAAPMVRVVRRVAPADLMPTDPGYGTEEKHTEVLFADWTPTNSAPHDENVEAYSNCQEVELFLNGKSLGAKPLPADAAPRVWNVAYAPGTLKAVAKNNGKIFATDELRTAGKPAKIILRPDRKTLANDWDDVARVTATVADENSVAVPGADGLIAFRISGPGVIAAVDNGGNASHEPFQAGERRAIQGRCVAFVKATAASGKSILTATAPGLTAGSAVFKISRLASTE